MKKLEVGTKVIISSSEADWKIHGKPHYIDPSNNSVVAVAYRNKDICTIAEPKYGDLPLYKLGKVYDLVAPNGSVLVCFGDWEIKEV